MRVILLISQNCRLSVYTLSAKPTRKTVHVKRIDVQFYNLIISQSIANGSVSGYIEETLTARSATHGNQRETEFLMRKQTTRSPMREIWISLTQSSNGDRGNMRNVDQFFRKSCYSNIRILLIACGAWPFQALSKRYAMYVGFTLLFGSGISFEVFTREIKKQRASV